MLCEGMGPTIVQEWYGTANTAMAKSNDSNSIIESVTKYVKCATTESKVLLLEIMTGKI